MNLLEIFKSWGLQLDYQPRGYLSQGMQRRLLDEVINPAVVSGSQQTKSIDEIKQSLIIQEKFLEWFIRQGAGLHYLKSNGGYSLLHIAVGRGFLNIVKLLLLPQYGYQVDLLAGYDFHYRDDGLLTSLQIAVEKNQLEIAKLLLMHGANPCVQIKKKETLLHIACDQGNEEMVRLLLTTAIDKDAISNQDTLYSSYPLRAIHYAAKFKDRDKANRLVNILLEYNVIVDYSLFLIMIENLLEKDNLKQVLVKLNKDEVIQKRALHVAVMANNLPACELLVEYYPQLLTLRDMQGCLPLHLATAGEKELIFEFLRKQKDDIAVRDYEGNDVIVHALCHDTIDELNLVFPKTIIREQIYFLRAKLIEEAEFVNANQYKLVQLLKYSYKLIELFETAEAALKFISTYRDPASKQPIHDLCLFQLPSSVQIWNKQVWKSFAQQYGTRLTAILHLAPIIEQILKRPPQHIEEIEFIASEVKYSRHSDNPALAQLFIQYKIPEEAYNRVLDSYQPKAIDLLPVVTIEGHNFNEPRYYLKKLTANDPLGFVLGAATHCCQSVGSAGEACAMPWYDI